jgi:chaperone required for assembly of F1-ATPase
MNGKTGLTEQPRRFWKLAEIGPGDASTWRVLLDGRPVRSPAGQVLTVPTQALAELIAAEWNGVVAVLDPSTMPATRLAFTAQDRIGAVHAETAAEVARFAGADLLCYFAAAPAALVARQETAWSPLLARAEAELGLAFAPTRGVVHTPQPPETLARVAELARGLDNFTLAGVAAAAGLFGSAILALALQRGWVDAHAAFDLSQVDETWQQDQWGVDAEAAERRAALREEALALGRWFVALGAG